MDMKKIKDLMDKHANEEYLNSEESYNFDTSKNINAMYALFLSEQEKLMDKIIGNESKYLDPRKLTELEKNYYLGRANLRSEQRARYKEIKK